jgi:signal transduction histidine kinase
MADKLFSRYNRISLPVILGIFLLSGISCYLWIDHILVADFDESLAEKAQKINLYIKTSGNFPKPEATDDWLFSFRRIDSRTTPTRFETVEHYDSEDNANVKFRQIVYSYPSHGNNYLITISKSLETLSGLSRSIALTTTLALLAVILVTLLLNHFVLKKLWRPFYHALELLKDFKLGKQKEIAFRETGTKEFNFMNKRLINLIQNAEKEYILLKEFTENASHEMQTPVSIIRSKLDMIVQGENLSAQQSDAMESAYQAVRRLANLGQALLLLSKIENNQFDQAVRIDLEDKLKEKIAQLDEFWLEKQISVSLVSMPAFITADPDLIDILLNNLLSNANRHNITRGIIDIRLNDHQLVVRNTGDEEAIDTVRIFTRFYKQKHHAMNNGLGLAIIKQICDQSGISIKYTFINKMHIFTLSW